LTVETTFDLLADAAQVRYPNPDRENRGLCPAHGDENNPGLVFTISDTTGNLIAHCFAQHCSIDNLADAIGVPRRAFFANSGSYERHAKHIPINWKEPSFLELLKLLPLGMSWQQTNDAIMRCLDYAHFTPIDNDTITTDLPLREHPLVTRLTYLSLWCEDVVGDHDWAELSDRLLSMMMNLNRDHRTSELAPASAIPRR
jgi:hypothetical protein